MNELKLFLRALEEIKNREVLYIDRLTITPQRPVTAYKEYHLEICRVDTKGKEVIVDISIIRKSVTESEDKNIKKELSKEAMKQVLKYYGIQ